MQARKQDASGVPAACISGTVEHKFEQPLSPHVRTGNSAPLQLVSADVRAASVGRREASHAISSAQRTGIIATAGNLAHSNNKAASVLNLLAWFMPVFCMEYMLSVSARAVLQTDIVHGSSGAPMVEYSRVEPHTCRLKASSGAYSCCCSVPMPAALPATFSSRLLPLQQSTGWF